MAKRIIAILGIAILVGTYIAALVAGITASPEAHNIFFAALVLTFVVPVIMWIFLRMVAHSKDGKGMTAHEMRKYNKRIKNGEDPAKIAEEIENKYNTKDGE
ncbi:MAG: hypothetical protein K6B75_07680 [Lachnospiraceae bacterium]|nr:hypothetical protein [Lachnospiraceae bacterium]